MRAYSLSLHRPLQLQCSQEKRLKKKIANVVSVQTGCESLLSISSPATAAALLAGGMAGKPVTLRNAWTYIYSIIYHVYEFALVESHLSLGQLGYHLVRCPTKLRSTSF